MSPTTAHPQRFQIALITMSFTALVLVIFSPMLTDWLPNIPASGHSHVHAHGHAFIDARRFLGIPNCLNVLSNLPFLLAGVWGLIAVRRARLSPAVRRAANVFFIGLLLTCAGSSYYHWAPTDLTLMFDRLGMGIAFSGVISLSAGSRLGNDASARATPVLLVLAPLAAVAAYSLHNVLPWAIVQFGGIALILWLAYLPKRAELPLKLFVLIGWYALAKLLEAQDEAVFELTGHLISGHSLKHIAACMAAWPVIASLKKS